MMKRFFSIAALSLALGMGAAQAASVYVQIAPPPVIVEHYGPPPSPRHVWVPGYYRWDPVAIRYVWVRGYWAVPPHPGWVWVPAHWVQRPRGWVFVPGHWRRP